MEKSESIAKLAAALSKAQEEMPAVPLTAFNPFFKSAYADLGSVIETAKPILAKNGLAVSQLAISDPGTVGVETLLMHVSGEWLSGRVTIPATAKAQDAGATITYLRRYAYSAILGMYADEDNDGNTGGSEQKKAAEKKPAEVNKALAPVTASAVIAAGWVKEAKHANALIAVLGIGKWTMDNATRLYAIYRPWRESGLEAKDAAEKAHAGEVYIPEVK